jgi:SAM-dependent methyltransferase
VPYAVLSPSRSNTDTVASIQAFVDCAIDAFELTGPVYRFGRGPAGGSGPWARLREGLGPRAYVDLFWEEDARIDRLPFPDGAARTVLCIDALGAAFQPHRAVGEMIRVLSPGGALLICSTAAASRPDQPPVSWRLAPRGLDRLLLGMAARVVGWQGDGDLPDALYAVGFKHPLGGNVLSGANQFLDRFPARLGQLARQAGWYTRLKRFLMSGLANPLWRRPPRRQGLQLAVHFSVDRRLRHEVLQGCLPVPQTGTRLDLME